jgi:hypothetical protein
MRIFCGYDEREAEGFDVFAHSVKRHASVPVHLFRLDSMGLPTGTNAFTLSRFLVPELCKYSGWAVYMDACDMLCLGDVAELAALQDEHCAVQVVKHDYKTRHKLKYVGSDMECPNRDYPRKNWASVMLINCAHPAWVDVSRESLATAPLVPTLQFGMLSRAEIGTLPDEWNRLVDEGQPVEGAKIAHWTAGTPFMYYYQDAPGADLWFAERGMMLKAA